MPRQEPKPWNVCAKSVSVCLVYPAVGEALNITIDYAATSDSYSTRDCPLPISTVWTEVGPSNQDSRLRLTHVQSSKEHLRAA